MRGLLEEILARHTGQTEEQVRLDIERDKILTAEQAKEYGIIDDVITTRKLSALTPVGCALTGDAGAGRRRRHGAVARDIVAESAATRPYGRCRRRPDGVSVDECTAERPGTERKGHRVARIGDGGDLLKCSFCGKSQKQVKKLIAGPGVYICDECIDLCNEIIEEELSETAELSSTSCPSRREIYEFLNGYVVGQDQAKKTLVGRRLQPLQAGPGRRRRRAARRRRPASSWPSRTSCCSARPAAARRCSRRRWPGCSTCRSPSPTPPRSPRPATSARTSRTSCSS